MVTASAPANLAGLSSRSLQTESIACGDAIWEAYMYLAVLDAEPMQRCFNAIDRYDIRLLLTL